MNNVKYFKHAPNLFKGAYLLNTFSFQFMARRHYPEVRKRFYKNVTVAGTQKCYEVNLDHGKLKTPSGNVLQIPNYPLALAVASEWLSVNEKIIPAWMHLTGLSFTVMDNPQHQTKSDVVEKSMEFLETDTLLFREDGKEDILKVQSQEWDPVLDWFNERFQLDLKPSEGICPVEVTDDAKEKLRSYFMSYDMWAAVGILYGVEVIKSVILTTACLERKISPEKAVNLTLLETEFQTERWGSVEWAHETDKYDLLSRFSAAILFAHLNSSDYVKKRKLSYR